MQTGYRIISMHKDLGKFVLVSGKVKIFCIEKACVTGTWSSG